MDRSSGYKEMMEDDDDNDSIIGGNNRKSQGTDNDDDDAMAEVNMMYGKEAESSDRGKNSRRNHRYFVFHIKKI